MFLNIKKWLYIILGVNYWRLGKCNQCGQCCRTIMLRFPDSLIKRETDFERLKEFLPRFNNFFISGKSDNGILFFTCKYLTDDNKCGAYWYRSVFCRIYPFFDDKFIKMGGKALEGCGYCYKPVREFKEIMESIAKK
ncbi:MAG: YkgJ family cysteine cluster protein [Vampirovibrionia bacterium]